jgi:hypothetical protein
MWGQGHTDGGDNSVYAVSLFGTPTISRLTNPSQVTVANYIHTPRNIAALDDGQPNARHTYNEMAYIPTIDKMYVFNGSLFGGIGNGEMDSWLFDLTAKTWGRVTPNGSGWNPEAGCPDSCSNYNGVYGAVSWDANTDLIFIGYNGQLISFNYTTSLYTLVKTQTQEIPYFGTAVIDTKRKTFWAIGGDEVHTWDIAPGGSYTHTNLTTSYDSSCAALVAGHAPGLHYNTDRDRIVGWAGGDNIYEFNPATLTCTAWKMTGGPGSATTNGIYGRFQYFPLLGTQGRYVVVADFGVDAYSWEFPAFIFGMGASTLTCIDKDGDGYGTGAGCLGPDADDDNAAVHTAAQAVSAYGSIPALYNRRGYFPSKYWILDITSGVDGTGKSCTPSTFGSCSPYQHWSAIAGSVAAGDAVVFRGGTYTYTVAPVAGSAGTYTYYLAYPGELPVFDTAQGGTSWNILEKSWFVVDGIKTTNGTYWAGGTYDGDSSVSLFINAIFRRIESSANVNNFYTFNGLKGLLIEESAFHDASNHNIYIGARNVPNVGVEIRRNLLYNGGLTGFQHNGRVTNLTVTQNIAYLNATTGISLENGASNSFINANLAFDNGMAFVISTNDGNEYGGVASGTDCGVARNENCTCSSYKLYAICAFNQTGNLVENNTFYSSGYTTAGADASSFGLVSIGRSGSCTTTFCLASDNGGNTYRNNLYVEKGNAADVAPWTVKYVTSPDPASTSIVQKAMFWQMNASTSFLAHGLNGGGAYNTYNCAAAATYFSAISGCSNADPLFTGIGVWNNAAGYNFRLTVGSPAIHAGVATPSVTRDLIGTQYANTPSMGAYEAASGVVGGAFSGGRLTIGGGVRR